MNMLIDELNMLSDDPKSWLVVLLLAGFAVHAIVGVLMCPYAHGKRAFSDEEVAEARTHKFRPGLRFPVMMMLGVALALAGLFMIASGTRPTMALAMLVAGILLLQTEPGRLQLREQKFAVVAASGGPEAQLTSARARLRGSHRALALTQATIVVGVVGILLAF